MINQNYQILQFLEENFPIKQSIQDVARYLKISFEFTLKKSETAPLDLFFNNIISLIEIGTIFVSEADQKKFKRPKRMKIKHYFNKVKNIRILINATGFQYLSQLRSEENAKRLERLTETLFFATMLLLSAALVKIIYSSVSNGISSQNIMNVVLSLIFGLGGGYLVYKIVARGAGIKPR